METLAHNASKIASRLVEIALHDDHPRQLEAIKMCMDRLVPIQKAVDDTAGSRPIAINIQVESAKRVIEAS
jgi:hypothetical protein